MKKVYLFLIMFCFSQFHSGQEKQLIAALEELSQVTGAGEGGLYFAGTKDVNYRFSQRITPHGDCVDVVNGYAFVTWYKGGMDTRNLMLSRKNLNVSNSNWITIEFPHKHVGQGGELLNGTGIRGDSHNTAAIGISTIDDTIHIIYDMHAYRSTSLPNDFFNYSVSLKNKAFVPDNEFTLAIFNPKQNYLKSGGDYERMTYPMIHRADDGSLIARYRQGGSGNGDILLAHYDGNVWSNNWLFHEGTLSSPNTNNMYGGERFLNGKFYSGFSIRYSTNNDINTSNGYMLNSGLYYAYTNGIPKNASTPWFDVNDTSISLPIRNNINPNLDPVQIAQPGDDYGTASLPKSSSDPAWTVTENGAIHFVQRVDSRNVHYYKLDADINFSSNVGGLIPNPQTRGEIYSYKNHVFMVELLGGKVNIKTTLEGQNDWKIVYIGTESINFNHFDAFVEGNKLYVYLMEDTGNNSPGVGDKRPLYFQEFTLSEEDTPTNPDIVLEAEDYTTASNNIVVGTNPAASGGEYIDAFAGAQFIEHKFQVTTAGTYDFILFAANRNRDDSIMDIEINGTLFEDVLITRTFDWNVYLETRIPNIILNQGENTVTITQRRSLSSEPDKIEFELKSALSINKFSTKKVSIYPNPSEGVFNLKSNIQNFQYNLINLHGQVIESGKVSRNKVDFTNNAQGVYFLKLFSETDRLIKKIVIK
ncbi:BNR-4 repeat-containing protein [Seonamhaeicola maritimus]|uniref:T9SS type A sorting domain-containing protein n=1 Tax=Seonamhaeicola maritimus TaxID=2591822 RepID=A0A5C7GMC4_9FLAO|nr:BNR-4 repeat-containing protein [Seonamhaeicola maritimus]TXG39493.1 T9SS type A sorting domain-containing protein [Seonamhaeicola maritimus]